MKRRHIVLIVIIALLVAGVALWFLLPYLSRMQEESRKQDLYERYVTLASRIVPRVWPDMKWSKKEIPPPTEFEVRNVYRVQCYSSYRPIKSICMTIGIHHDVLHIYNTKIAEEIERRMGAGEKPKLTIPEVIERAHHYLKLLEQEIPPDYGMKVWYGSDGEMAEEPVWWVKWEPCVNGVFFDDSLGWPNAHIYMIFHEDLGLKGYYRKVNIYPMPRSMEIRISAAEAAERAASLLPDFLKGPYYAFCCSWYGYSTSNKISRLRETRLVLFEPNWALDRNRPFFFTEACQKVPKETRLCWRVTFEAKQEYEPGKTPPALKDVLLGLVILIFIDAKTGEGVGAVVNLL